MDLIVKNDAKKSNFKMMYYELERARLKNEFKNALKFYQNIYQNFCHKYTYGQKGCHYECDSEDKTFFCEFVDNYD
ncbi:hypothetical protein COBT_004161 [Conglomerata obtusa]